MRLLVRCFRKFRKNYGRAASFLMPKMISRVDSDIKLTVFVIFGVEFTK